MIEGLAACFAGLADPRATRRCDHRLIDILVIAACAVIACAESWEDIELYGCSKQAWLKTFLALPNGIPSHDTFRRVFMLIDPDAFEACFARWAQSLMGKVEREVVAIDGKTVRRSGSRRHDHGPLHLVSAWASDQGLVLGQREVDGKSNEITAVPELLDTLHLDGSIVTLDAMGCQKDIAARIRAQRADYLLGLKANHGRAFEAVRDHFERTCFGRGSGGRPVFDAFDESHGRLVRRRVFVSPAVRELEPLRDWPDLRAVLAVEAIRGVNGTGKIEAETRYFLTSCGDDPAVLVRAIRRHWSIENALHWVLDVTFHEDDSRVRDRTAARNLALLRKIALNLVARDHGSQTSLRGRRKKAAWNDNYMLQIIANQAHA
ncbi:MAG TPA: ISAs1 family transposase [Myxococcales bacterium]|jgi:predicted transposase YbfD/YdcC|nr:ISAs1 family transposase [Myxococcales bacterium]